jgi:alkylation response protein AidB-like acyl-CoA dehydrogenase
VYFELSEAQEILRQTVRRFLAESAPLSPYVRRHLAEPRGTTDPVWRGLCELGLTGLLVPENLGGAGLGMVEMGVVCEEMGRALHPGPFATTALASASLIGAVASPEERSDLLPALAAGRLIATLAFSEPGGRFGGDAPRTTAQWRRDAHLLSGEKHLVPYGLAADLLLVTAGDAATGALGVFAVDPRGEGVSISATEGVDPTRKLARVVLAGARGRRLGDGDARAEIAAAIDRAAIGSAADALGAATRVHELALAYARERVQFDRPIGSFQAVQHLLVDMLQDLELARAGIYYAMWAADAAQPAERHRAATMAKAFASGRLPPVGANAIQVFGGIGFTWEHDAHLFYRRLLGMEQSFGDERAHLEELARIAIDQTVDES